MKGICKLLSVTIIAVSLQMPFSIFSYAVGYDFSEMGDTDNQSFSGHNDVYTNGIYVGGSGTNIYFDTIMENSNNTYNGTSDIDNTAYPADSYDSRSTYNGTLNVNANDVLSSAGINYVNEATVNADTAVTVNEVLADNTLNAGVQFNDSEFNGDVTLSGSGNVNLAGSTVNNLVLGNIPQMADLINQVKMLIEVIVSDTITYNDQGQAPAAANVTVTTNGVSLTRNLPYYTIYRRNVNYNVTPAGLTESVIRYRSSLIRFLFNNIYALDMNLWNELQYILSILVYNINNNFNTFWSAYLPNKLLSQAQYWIAYNTDTDSYDSVNLATVFGYITWYLGQLYIQGNEAASDISQSVANLDTTLSTLEQKEAQINTQIKNSADDIDDFFNLPTIVNLGVILGWLQYMWVSLDIFQSVTYIGWALILLSIIAGFYKVKQGYV